MALIRSGRSDSTAPTGSMSMIIRMSRLSASTPILPCQRNMLSSSRQAMSLDPVVSANSRAQQVVATDRLHAAAHAPAARRHET